MRLTLPILLILPSLAAAQTNTADLRWKPKEGQVVVYDLHQKSTNTTVVAPAQTKGQAPKRPPNSKPNTTNNPNATIDSTIDQTLTLRLTVKESSKERGSKVELTITRVRMSIKADEFTTEVDSDIPAKGAPIEDPIAASIREIAGTTMQLTVDPNGNITKSEGGGVTAGLSSLLRNGGKNLRVGGPQDRAVPKDALGLISSPTSTPASVKVGQRWTTASTLTGSLLSDVAITTTNTLKKLLQGTAHVAMVGALEPVKRDPKQDHGSPFQVTSASISGNYQWDTTSGWLDNLKMTQQVRTEYEDIFERSGESRTMDSTTETTITRVKAPDPR
jgi:hypothetical protein